jgi:hypothetical protein
MNIYEDENEDDDTIVQIDEELEHEANIRTIQILRKSERAARAKLCELEDEIEQYRRNERSVNAKNILTSILRELCTHYEIELKQTKTTQSILSEYYVIDPNNNYHILPTNVDIFIENLWYGRTKHFLINFMDNNCMVQLHPSNMKDGLPMVIINVNGTEMCIAKRKQHLTHMHMYRFQPIIQGMEMKSEVATKCLRYISSLPDSISLWPNNDDLESIAAVWLRRPRTTPAKSTLQVNSAAIEKFLSFISTKDTQCHFLLSGQKSLFAYIQVTCNLNEVYMLPVGSVEM